MTQDTETVRPDAGITTGGGINNETRGGQRRSVQKGVDVSYVDLHLHLLPGIDDGARSLPAALDHAARMAEDGVRDAAVTPHVGHALFDVDVRKLPERTAALQQAIDAAGIELRLHLGGELHPS